MTNEIIFAVQVGSIVTFVLALFAIYRSLAAQKDSVIELLREKVIVRDEKIKQLEAQTPDALTTSLSARVDAAIREIDRLQTDGNQHKQEIDSKKEQLRDVQERLTSLSKLIKQSDLVCHECGAPLWRRTYHPIFGPGDQEAEIEFVEYECGATFDDGRMSSPCRTILEG